MTAGREGHVIKVAAVILMIALTISAFVECVQTRVPRLMPRWLWCVVIVVVPVLGPLAWFLAGRVPTARTQQFPGRRRGPSAPDDDPSFLRELDDEAWRRKAREQREGGSDTPV
jgi:hypothetical protein